MLERWVLTTLRVPADPQPPEGSPGSIQVFRAGRNYYKWCVLVWAISNAAIFFGLIGAHVMVGRFYRHMPGWAQIWWRLDEIVGILVFAGSLILSFFSQRLNYGLRWYMVTDRSLRIRTGIVRMQELTMTFSNIQEIRVTSGPLQKFLGLADVEVQSAGGASERGKSGGHVGRFEGVSNANEIRDLLVERLRQYRDSGLGEPVTAPAASPDDAIQAARAVLAEVRALRAQHLS